MSTLEWIATVYACVFCGIWILYYLKTTHTLLSVTYFAEVAPVFPESWPTLSIIVAACNEEDTIEHAAKSLLQLDYPGLEIIMIDDRSSDDTGAIIDRIASGDQRVLPLHIKELPKGWLGKNHALHKGVARAGGEWLLFTDADIHFKKGTLRKAIAHVIGEDADHLAMFPRVHAKTFWLRAVMETFSLFFVTSLMVERLGKKGSRAFVGAGGFNLIRRAAYDRTPGFEWLKMELVDDVGLGLMLRDVGAKSLYAMTRDAVTAEWYPTLSAMNRGLEKNTFPTIGHFSIFRMSILTLLPWLTTPAPFLAVWLPGAYWLPWMGVGAAVSLVFCAVVNQVRAKGSFLLTLLIPISQLILSLFAVNSMVTCIRRGGIVWRGTLYPLDELKKQQRLRLH